MNQLSYGVYEYEYEYAVRSAYKDESAPLNMTCNIVFRSEHNVRPNITFSF